MKTMLPTMPMISSMGDSGDHIAEHDAHQRHHDHILELDALDEPDEDPCPSDGKDKGEKRPPPQGGLRHEQQCQQDPELSRGNGGARAKRTCSYKAAA